MKRTSTPGTAAIRSTFSTPSRVSIWTTTRSRHLEVTPALIPALEPYLIEQSKLLVEQKQINAVPDWDRALVRGPLREAMRA